MIKVSTYFAVTCFSLAGFILMPSGAAFATPEMAGKSGSDRFTLMDKDKSGSVSREEFFTAQPHMKEGAFASIDSNADGNISTEEWQRFFSGHGKDAMQVMPSGMSNASQGLELDHGHPQNPASNGTGTPELIMPPEQN